MTHEFPKKKKMQDPVRLKILIRCKNGKNALFISFVRRTKKKVAFHNNNLYCVKVSDIIKNETILLHTSTTLSENICPPKSFCIKCFESAMAKKNLFTISHLSRLRCAKSYPDAGDARPPCRRRPYIYLCITIDIPTHSSCAASFQPSARYYERARAMQIISNVDHIATPNSFT